MTDRETFAAQFDVPRGTLDRLDRYAELLTTYQERLNLVGPSTLAAMWTRHFADSAQLAALTTAGLNWLDMGAGAGFPGLVLAILGHARVTLAEATAKKCAFLQAAVDATGATADVVNGRVEALHSLAPDVITARAFAPLDRLLGWALPHARPDTLWILPKGSNAAEEVATARKRFAFEATMVQSVTDSAATILCLRSVRALGASRGHDDADRRR